MRFLRRPSPLEKALGYRFKNPALLEEALTHPSYSHEKRDVPSNERLEFLGDAVLGLLLAEDLFRQHPKASEGEMTQIRASHVSGEALARQARVLGLGEYLRLGKGEEASGGRKRPSNLAHALEALVGAAYIDRGLKGARAFLEKVRARGEGGPAPKMVVDYKSRLQQSVQALGKAAPRYRVLATEGPPHSRRYTVEVMVEGMVVGQGQGRSKKGAEQAAARSALEKLVK